MVQGSTTIWLPKYQHYELFFQTNNMFSRLKFCAEFWSQKCKICFRFLDLSTFFLVCILQCSYWAHVVSVLENATFLTSIVHSLSDCFTSKDTYCALNPDFCIIQSSWPKIAVSSSISRWINLNVWKPD